MSTPDLHAIIFSGGGADGAYQLGVVNALFSGKSRATFKEPMEPEVFTGTSIGSFNASFLVSHWEDYGPAAVGKLEKVWLEKMAWQGATNGGFRVRLNPFELLDPRSYMTKPYGLRPLMQLASDTGYLSWDVINRMFNLVASNEPLLQRFIDFVDISSFVAVEPWERTLREEIDYKKIRNSKKLLRIAATNWAFGEVKEFQNRDMTNKRGPAAIRASSSVPGIYPPAKVGAQSYVDGAVLMNTPLSPAIKAMRQIIKDPLRDPKFYDLPVREAMQVADMERGSYDPDTELVLHVIYMNTDVDKMPIAALQSTMQTLYRTQIISWANAVNQDIEKAGLLNQGLDYIENIGDLNLLDKLTELERRKKDEKLSDDEAEELRITKRQLEGKVGELKDLQETLGKLSPNQLRNILQSAKPLVDRMETKNPYKRVTVHRYFPPDGLDGALGFLDVRRQRFERLIEEGFNNTVHHDCKTNGCILAGRHKILASDY